MTDLDWTRTGPAFPARFHGECPHPECPKGGVIAPGERIVKLAVPKRKLVRTNATRGWTYKPKRLEYAHVGCTVEREEREYQEPVCECGASLVVEGEVLLKCPSCDSEEVEA